MFKGYVSGLLSGLLLSVSGFVVASVVTPLPERFAAEPRDWVPKVYEGLGLADGVLPGATQPGKNDLAPAATDPALAEAPVTAEADTSAGDLAAPPAVGAVSGKSPQVMPPPVLSVAPRGTALAEGQPPAVEAPTLEADVPSVSGKSPQVMPPPVLSVVPRGTAVAEGQPPAVEAPTLEAGARSVSGKPSQVMPPPVLFPIPSDRADAGDTAGAMGPAIEPEGPADLAGLPPQSSPPQLPLEEERPPVAEEPAPPEAPSAAAPDLQAGADSAPGLPALPPETAASPAVPAPPEADQPIAPRPLEDGSVPDMPPAPIAPGQDGSDAAPSPEADLPPETARGAGRLATAGAEGRASMDAGRGRLPQIGGTMPPIETAPETAPTAPGLGDFDAALTRNARPFANPDRKAPFVILLRDTGRQDLDLAALAASDLPMTLVVDPAQPQAAERAATWRAAGQEVALLSAALPAGATASDVEVTLEGLDQLLPQALAVVEAGNGQGGAISREMASRLVPGLKTRGFGLVSWDAGLKQADQVARREGLPAARIFRDLDAKDEAAPVIRRYLDRAAFKAQQDGHVLVMGDLRPETLAAVHEWSLEGRVSGLALAPLSAVLRPAP